jgi:hypothetical protein|tara:strand:+ start:141 stop:1088 length:948 start_codon:yes stop_codon:yes gene_type:complete
MARTNFSGPINVGRIQNTTGTSVSENVRNVAFVECHASFPVNHSNFTVTTDANKLAVTGSNGAGTTSVTLLDATQNVPGITSDGGFEAASVITLTSAGNDSGLTATITGTDVLGNAQTEAVAPMGNAGLVSSTKTFQTVSSIAVSGAGTVGTLEVGVIETGLISVICRSTFNEYPLGQTATTSGKNLANNIVIPKFSRINDIRFVVNEAFDTAGFDMQIGANVAQAAGATLNSLDLDYFAGDADNDVKAIASHHIPTGMDQTVAQMKNCLNVSDDDAAGYEMDKAVVITAKTDDALTAGEGVLNMYWTQLINNTN